VNRTVGLAVFALIATSMCLAQNAPAMQTSAAPTTDASDRSGLHGTIPVSLAKSIDSKKLKEGDEIPAKTVTMMRTADGVMIPTGSKVVGHVTQSKARSKGDSESSLGIAFDKIELPGGKALPIKGVLQAVGPNPSESSGPDTGAAGGGTMAAHGGDATTMASPVSGAGLAPGQKLEKQGSKMLTPQSTGVVGIKNLQLDNSVLTSTGKEVKLDMGSQMMIKAE
jgi:hypothetical protein